VHLQGQIDECQKWEAKIEKIKRQINFICFEDILICRRRLREVVIEEIDKICEE